MPVEGSRYSRLAIGKLVVQPVCGEAGPELQVCGGVGRNGWNTRVLPCGFAGQHSTESTTHCGTHWQLFPLASLTLPDRAGPR